MRSVYYCGNCGRHAEHGARWCANCKSTNMIFVASEPEAGGVLQIGAPRIIDDKGVRPDAQDPPPVSPGTLRPREPAPLPMQSRRKAGVTTVGLTGRILMTTLLFLPLPLVWYVFNTTVGAMAATAFTLGMGGVWVIVAWLTLKDIWRKDSVDGTAAPLRESFRETRRNLGREYRERRGRETSIHACASCGAARRKGERRCYRCGSSTWAATDGPGNYWLCSACDSPWDMTRKRLCDVCNAPKDKAIFIQAPKG